MTSNSASELRLERIEDLEALPGNCRVLVRSDSHALGVLVQLLGEDAGRSQFDLLAAALEAKRNEIIDTVVEIPFTTLSAPHLEDQLGALAKQGASEVRVIACPQDAPYDRHHRIEDCFSSTWIEHKRRTAAEKARDLGLVYRDLMTG